MHYIPFTR